jgi:uncharacterized protein YjbJ (UPF0337 family)
MDNDRAKAAVNELGGKIQNASGNVADYAKIQARRLSASAEDSLHDAFGQAKEAARGASAIAGEASALASDSYDRSGRYLKKVNRAVGGQIGDNTLTALLLAGAAGYLLSYFVHSGR